MAMLLLVSGIVALTIFPPVLDRLKSRALQQQKNMVLGLRNTVLGFAMDNCRLPTREELKNAAPHYELDQRTVYVLPDSPELTSTACLKTLDADADTDLSLLAPVQEGEERIDNLAFIVLGTGLNHTQDLEAMEGAYVMRVPGERFEQDGSVRVYDDLVRAVTLESLCKKTGCCK